MNFHSCFYREKLACLLVRHAASDNNLLIGDFPKDSEIHANCLGMSLPSTLYRPRKKNESLLAYFGNGHGKFHDIVLFLKYYFWFLRSDSTTQGHRVQNSQ